ncbi:MAG: hypothetical protein BGO87_07455 [Flavobacteriia bacterium 40-80]|nr:MAG: hypothetical protein BGO87_07455 [Flavobacteriia bacterium 40-80]
MKNRKHSDITHKRMEKEKNQCSDLIVKASIKRKPRFKAGSDLSSTVNVKRMDVEVNDESTEDTEAFDITLHLKSCAVESCNP